jgi:hypothetical protein
MCCERCYQCTGLVRQRYQAWTFVMGSRNDATFRHCHWNRERTCDGRHTGAFPGRVRIQRCCCVQRHWHVGYRPCMPSRAFRRLRRRRGLQKGVRSKPVLHRPRPRSARSAPPSRRGSHRRATPRGPPEDHETLRLRPMPGFKQALTCQRAHASARRGRQRRGRQPRPEPYRMGRRSRTTSRGPVRRHS